MIQERRDLLIGCPQLQGFFRSSDQVGSGIAAVWLELLVAGWLAPEEVRWILMILHRLQPTRQRINIIAVGDNSWWGVIGCPTRWELRLD